MVVSSRVMQQLEIGLPTNLPSAASKQDQPRLIRDFSGIIA